MPENELNQLQEAPIVAPNFEIQVIGEFRKSDVEVVDSLKEVKIDNLFRDRVALAWEKRKGEVETKGGHLEDRPKVVVLKREVKSGKISLVLGHSTYKDYVGLTDREVRLGIAPDSLPVFLGTAALLETADNYLVLNERSQSVFQYEGWLSVFAGSVELEDLNENGVIDPFVTAVREIKEETQIKDMPIEDISCIGFSKDRITDVEAMLFYVKTSLTKKEIKDAQSGQKLDEGSSVYVSVQPDDVRREILKFSKIFVSDGVAPLLLLGRKRFGEEWFNFVLSRLKRRDMVYSSLTAQQRETIEERLINKLSRTNIEEHRKLETEKPKKSVVILDFGGVIIKDPGDSLYNQMAAKAGVSREALMPQLSNIIPKMQVGEIDEKQAAAILGSELNAKITDPIDFWDYDFVINEQVAGLIREMISKKIEIAILTNTIPSHLIKIKDIINRTFPDISGRIYASCELGKRKSGQAGNDDIFREVLERLHVDASKVLYIDDLQDYVDQATTDNIEALQYDVDDEAFKSKFMKSVLI